MNDFGCKKLRKLKGKVDEEKKFKSVNEIINFYTIGLAELGLECDIELDDMSDFFLELYDIFNLRFDDDTFIKYSKEYLVLLFADIRDDSDIVDIKWCIDKLFYYSRANEDFPNMYKDIVPYSQEKLIEFFDIKEKFSKRLDRKLSTYLLNF